jgi:cytochrome-b5 reductase
MTSLDDFLKHAYFMPVLTAVMVLLVVALLWNARQIDKERRGNGASIVDRGVDDVSLGLLAEENKLLHSKPSDSDLKSRDASVLHPAEFRAFALVQKRQISPHVAAYRFKIPDNLSLGLAVGRHLSVRADIRGVHVTRAYTPISRPDQPGYFELLVKTYEFGKMSQHMEHMSIGDTLLFRGPVGRFKFTPGTKHIGMLAGGTGITPCIQLMRCILELPEYKSETTRFTLLFQNRKREDVLLRDDLDSLERLHPGRVSVQYFLSNPDTKWGKDPHEERGYISAEKVNAYVPRKSCDLVCVCGPSGFNSAMEEVLVECNYTPEAVHVW